MKRVGFLTHVFLLLILIVCMSIFYSNRSRDDDDDDSVRFVLDIDNLTSMYCPVEEIYVKPVCLTQLELFDTTRGRVRGPVLYHTFWEPSKMRVHHEYVMRLSILSFLATQDTARTRLVIWTLNKLRNEEELKFEFKNYIDSGRVEFRILDFQKLCAKGLYMAHAYEACSSMKYGNFVALSDFVRWLVLYNYGGIYVDGDVMFLRDMRTFWKKNFVYRWSATNSYNTAVMGIDEEATLGEDTRLIYKHILNKTKTVKELVNGFYPSKISNAVNKLNNGAIYNYTGLRVYHSVLFDPSWLCNDHFKLKYKSNVCKFSDFYERIVSKFDVNKVFPGSFTHHLHLGNCGSCTIKNMSYFHHFQKHFESKLQLFS